MKGVALAVMSCSLACGCATQYQSTGFTGGYHDGSGPGGLQQVKFSGNGYTEAQAVQKFALYRAAEIAQSHSKPYFILYEGLFAAAMGVPADLPRVGTIGRKPIASAFLLELDETQPGAKETQAVLRDLNDFVHKTGSAKAQGDRS